MLPGSYCPSHLIEAGEGRDDIRQRGEWKERGRYKSGEEKGRKMMGGGGGKTRRERGEGRGDEKGEKMEVTKRVKD